MFDRNNISPFTLSMSLNHFTSSYGINWGSYSRYNIHSFMSSLPHISTSDIRCTSQNRIHRTMQRIFYKRKIVRTFNLWQLNLTKFLSTTEFPLHFWNWILPSSGIRSCNSTPQKNRKNQIFYLFFSCMNNFRFTKIIPGVSPTLAKETVLSKIINMVDVFRITLSKGFDDNNKKYIDTIMKLDNSKTILIETKGIDLRVKNTSSLPMKK